MSELPINVNNDTVARMRKSAHNNEIPQTGKERQLSTLQQSIQQLNLAGFSGQAPHGRSVEKVPGTINPDDINTDSLMFRFSKTPKEQLYARVPLAVQQTSVCTEGNPLSDVGASVMAVQQETVRMLSKQLPHINEDGLHAKGTLPQLVITSQGNVVDDRITPQTLLTLLKKGCFAASKVNEKQKFHLFAEEKVPKAISNLEKVRTNVQRLEPYYVEQSLQAKVSCKPHNDDGTAPREVLHNIAMNNGQKRHTVRESAGVQLTPNAALSSQTCEKGMEGQFASFASPVSPKNDLRKKKESTINASITRLTVVGDDNDLINQVIDYAVKQRRPDIGGTVLSNMASGIPTTHPSYSPLFSFLDAVLSVSKEYEKVQQTWPGGNAANIGVSRRAIIDRITSLKSSLIPRVLWITIHSPTFPGYRLRSQEHEVTTGSALNKNTLIFPAANAVGRGQVYLLAATLDSMLREIPDAVAVLADKQLAQVILPEELYTNSLSKSKVSKGFSKLLDFDSIKNSDAAHLQYVGAAEKVLEVVNVGLVELVRQLSSLCAERGALLDAIRIVFTDVTSTCLWLVGYCKSRTRSEAEERMKLIEASQKDVEELMLLREEVRSLRNEVSMLTQANGELENRATKYDTLIERLELKNAKFFKHSSDDHLRLLMELEECYAELTTKGLEGLYEYQEGELRDNEELTKAPTTRMNLNTNKEKKAAEEELYVQSYRLLKALTSALESVDETCRPLYEQLELPPPGLAISVASMKWAKIAHAVGSYELEKKHRQRVFKVFAQWNGMQESPKKTLNETLAADENGNEKYGDGTSLVSISAEESTTTGVYTPPSTLNDEEISKLITTRNKAIRKCAKLITKEDLVQIGATDCTPEEVNALYDQNFDFVSFLRPTYVGAEKYEMDTRVLCDMVHFVTESLRHISLRVNTLANSKLIKECLKLPMKPPTRPHDACPLCGRLDYVTIEKKNKGEAMQRVASEIQRRYDEAVKKFQNAEVDRDAYSKEIQRLQMELKKNMQLWTQTESDLRQENALLVEENRRLAQHVFLSMNSPEHAKSYGSSVLNRVPPATPSLSSQLQMEVTGQTNDETKLSGDFENSKTNDDGNNPGSIT